MSARHIPDWAQIAFALPVYQIWHTAKYARTRNGWPAKIGVVVTFAPIFVLCTAIWGTVWAMTLRLIWDAVN